MDVLQEIEKNGYARLEGGDLNDPNAALEALVSEFAEPIAYLGLPMVMDLKPQPGYQPASFAGTGKFDMHTDLSWYEKPARYIGMFCVHPESAGGGIPLLSDGWAAFADMDAEDAHYLTTAGVTFPPPSHIDYAPLTGPIISQKTGRKIVRFRFDMLDQPAPPIQRYFEAINDHIFEVEVSPGTMFVFDNDRMLHGRTQLKADMASDRFFKRIYADEPTSDAS